MFGQNELQYHLEIGLRAQERGDLETAISAFRQALMIDPDDPQTLYLLGVTLLQFGDPAHAVSYLEHAARKLHDQPAVTCSLAQAYFALGRYAEAYRAFRASNRLDPGELQFQLGMAAALGMQRRFSEAGAILRALAKRFPRHPLVWFNLGNLLRDQGRAEQAAENYRRALSIDPALVDARNNLGNSLQSLQQYDAAAAEFRECLRMAPQFSLAKCNLASVLIDLGRFMEAEALCKEATTLAPKMGLAHAFLGIARSRQGRLRDALECQRTAARLAPGEPRVIESYASVLADTGSFREGMRAFACALKLNPDSFSARWKACLAELRHGCFGGSWIDYRLRPLPDQLRKYSLGTARKATLPAHFDGRRVCILPEQGVGDEIFFLRYAPQLHAAGARIAYRASKKLCSLINRVPCIDEVLAEHEEPASKDMVILAGDLPHALDSAPASPLPITDAAMFQRGIPASPEKISVFWPPVPPPLPMTPLAGNVAEVRKRLAEFGPPPYLGITWRGGTPPAEQRGRPWMLYKEIGLVLLAAAVRGFMGTFVALQRNPAPGELQVLASALGQKVLDLTALNEDLEDMLAALTLIEEYVAVSNTNLHLRAGAGKTTRVLVPCPPDWRWMDAGRSSPWFPGCQVYRQSLHGDWDAALAALKLDLNNNCKSQ